MDADEIAVAIAMRLKAKNVKYKFLGSGRECGPEGTLIWETVVVDAYDPVRRDFVRLDSIAQAELFLADLETSK